MKKEVKNILAKSSLALVMTLTMFTSFANAATLSLFNNTLVSKVQPNCYMRREYNDFTRQWTDNEICNPRVYDIDSAVQQTGFGRYTGQQNVIYSAPNYQANNTLYVGNRNNSYLPNTWNSYGNATNYLLSSFGGGYGGNTYSSLLSPYFNYGSYKYPNSVGYYTPSVYDSYEPFYSEYSLYEAPYDNFNYDYESYSYPVSNYPVESSGWEYGSSVNWSSGYENGSTVILSGNGDNLVFNEDVSWE